MKMKKVKLGFMSKTASSDSLNTSGGGGGLNGHGQHGGSDDSLHSASAAMEAAEGIRGGDSLTSHGRRSLQEALRSGASSIKGSIMKRRKDKPVSLMQSWKEEDAGGGDAASPRSCLPPPMPPVAPSAPRLRRVNSSTMSLGRTAAGRKRMLTLEELYVEILYCVLHMIGCDAERGEQAALIEHLKEAFHMSNEKHKALLDIASMREEPYLKANLEIFGARHLVGKDMSGSSDPFCTFYLTTNPLSRFNTSYKPRTLDPEWNEDFVLDVNSIDNDSIRIDVWDFNPDENVSDKFKRINEIKDGRGLRKFIKETLNAGAGKINHELIGSVEIPLRTVPSAGMDKWFPLEKPDSTKRKHRGDIHVAITLSTEKDQSLTSQEHKHLLKILFGNELQTSQAQPFKWNGTFCKESVSILGQHAVQGKLTGAETALARWLVYAHTHCDLPLDYRVFHPILKKLNYAIVNGLFHHDDEMKFAETAVIFTHHCTEFIRKHRHFVGSDPEMGTQLEYILKCLSLISSSLEGRDSLLDSPAASTPTSPAKSPSEQRHLAALVRKGGMCEQVEEAVGESAMHWCQYIVESTDEMVQQEQQQEGEDGEEEGDGCLPPDLRLRTRRLRRAVALTRLLIADLREGSSQWHVPFRRQLGVAYLRQYFDVYQREVTAASRRLVESTCEMLKPIAVAPGEDPGPRAGGQQAIDETLAVGTLLFELYITLKMLADLGKDMCPEVDTCPSTAEFMSHFLWFNKAVARWLDIALYKAMQRIRKAVQLDDLKPVDDMVKHSSSAVDIKTVLLQVKTFWKQLSWPDVEASYAFISKILDDICKTSIYYAEQMCGRVLSQTIPKRRINNSSNRSSANLDSREEEDNTVNEDDVPEEAELGGASDNNRLAAARRRPARRPANPRSSEFVVTPELCLAINNIDFVLDFIRPFVTELGLEDIFVRLEALSRRDVAHSCRRTIKTLVQNATENVENKILEVLERIGEKMAPIIQKFLIEGSSRITYAGRDKESLIQYLDKNMIVLKEELNETNFDRVLSVIWESSAQSLHNTIMLSIDRQKPPAYFKTLLDILKILINFFYGDKLPQDETLLKMKSVLQLYASDSNELISRYLWERYKEQKAIRGGEYTLGSITLRCQMLREHLRVEVLNARHLKPPNPQTYRITDKSFGVTRRRRLSNSNLYRSSLNLDWMKSKLQSFKTNLQEASLQFHTQANAGQCDPYAVLRLVPETKFSVWPKFRTRVQRRTLFPLFDETFDFVLSGLSPLKLSDCYLQVVVKDRGIIPGTGGVFLGEALIPLREIQPTDNDADLSELPQMQVPLSRPKDQDSDIMLALDSRAFDRVAKEFLQKEKKKL